MPAESPASKAIRLLGAKQIAHACDVTTNAVYKWREGDGLIPSRQMPTVWRLAQNLGKPLTALDIIGIAA
jgi:hypothetical protein